MLIKPEISFAFKCSACAEARVHTFDAFSLSAESRLCTCSCNRSTMYLSVDGGVASVELHCPYCSLTHVYCMPLCDLLHDSLSELVCGKTKLVCAYAGDRRRVERAVQGYHEALDTMARKLGKNDHYCDKEDVGVLVKTGDGMLDEANLILSALCTAEDLLHAEKIACPCGSKRFELAFLNGYLQVKCGDCGAYVRLKAKSQKDIEAMGDDIPIFLLK